MNILIIEPNSQLHSPYSLLSGKNSVKRVTSIELGLKNMSLYSPDLAFISSSLSISKILTFLESLKNASHTRLIPLIFVIDLSYKLSIIPGTTWGNKLGILTSISSENELNSTIHRITSE